MCRVIILLVIFKTAALEATINERKLSYEQSLNSSLSLDKDDKKLLAAWSVDIQVKRVNITTKYRLEMTRHQEHSFRRPDNNAEWADCVYRSRRLIRKLEKDYYTEEFNCLTTTVGDGDKRQAVEQIAKEMRKWRKGYKYLVSTCNAEYPEHQTAADTCLVGYMERDSYSLVIQKLIILKLAAMGELFLQLESSVRDLEHCLQAKLSGYLTRVREMRDSLDKCYSLVDS